jgi:peptidoglycan/LPS O-acetylase OafA/YrhL
MYLTNFLVFRTGNWPGMFSHLWSLAVEEQFYLFWPILVLFFKEKKLDLIILFTFVISIILKLTSFFFVKNQFIDLLPFSQFDLFMFGAYLTVKKDYLVSRTQEFSQYKLTLSLVFTSILVVITGDNYLIKNISVGFFSTFLILVINFNRTIFKLFDFKPFIFLGRISYGLYLYHNFIPLFARNLVGTEKKYILFQKVLPNYNSVVYNLSIEFILLIVLSTLSWYLIEKRFLKLKITDY